MIENIPGLSVNAATALQAPDHVLVRRDAELARQFQIGQTLQLRVLDKIAPQRFTIMLGGGERVMESGLPLRPGDVLHGRVTELGDQIVIERLRVEQAGAQSGGKSTSTHAALLQGEMLAQGRLNLQRPLSRTERQAIDAAAKRSKDASLAQTVGLALRNLNIELSGTAVMEATELFRAHSGVEAVDVVPAVEGRSWHGEEVSLPDTLKENLERPLDADAAQPSDAALFKAFLNGNGMGCVHHRFDTVPVQVHDRIVPLSLALFEEGQEGAAPEAVSSLYRSGSISLATETLGRLEIEFLLRESQISVVLTGDKADTIEALQAAADALRSDLRADGWEAVLRYENADERPTNTAERVLNHLANLDRYETRA